MTQRIQLILKSMNLSPSQLAAEIDIQRSSLSHILSGRNKPSLDFIKKVLSSFPEISPNWLLFGKGTMINKPENSIINRIESEKHIEDTETTTPLFQESKTKSLKKRKEPDIEVDSTKISPDTKDVEKIIIFYTNSTFKVYHPNL